MKMRNKKGRQNMKMDMKAGIPIMQTDTKKERQKQLTRYQKYLQKLSQRMMRNRRRCGK